MSHSPLGSYRSKSLSLNKDPFSKHLWSMECLPILMRYFSTLALQPMTFAHPGNSYPGTKSLYKPRSQPITSTCLPAPDLSVLVFVHTFGTSELPAHCLCSLCPHGLTPANNPRGQEGLQEKWILKAIQSKINMGQFWKLMPLCLADCSWFWYV